jgi:hypothetical protein
MYFQTGDFLKLKTKTVRRTGAAQSLVAVGGYRKKKESQNTAAHRVAPAGWPGSAIGDVHRDFKAKAHVAGSRFFPFHTVSPECLSRKARLEVPAAHLLARFSLSAVRGISNIRKIWIGAHDFHEFGACRAA